MLIKKFGERNKRVSLLYFTRNQAEKLKKKLEMKNNC
jgi:hypothetical protein